MNKPQKKLFAMGQPDYNLRVEGYNIACKEWDKYHEDYIQVKIFDNWYKRTPYSFEQYAKLKGYVKK